MDKLQLYEWGGFGVALMDKHSQNADLLLFFFLKEMPSTYLTVVYFLFFVFLIILAHLPTYLPSLVLRTSL